MPRRLRRRVPGSQSQRRTGRFLADPTLELRDSNGTLIRKNNNWRDSQAVEIEETSIPPTHELGAAIVTSVGSGNYTVILRGHNDTTGVAVVEVYNLR